PGQRVEAGDEVAVLADREKESRYQELVTQLQVYEAQYKSQLGANNPTGAALAREQADLTREQVADYEQQLRQLRIVAPIAGVVVAAPRKPEPKLTQPRIELSGWYGTPLDGSNRGCLIEAGTHIVSIAPDEKFQAVLLIDQEDRGDVDVGR